MKDLGRSPTGEGHPLASGVAGYLTTRTRGKTPSGLLISAAATLILGATSSGSAPLTLAQAQALGLQNHPGILASDLRDRANEPVVGEARAAYLPTFGGGIAGNA